jgi:hypothetical protein
VAARIVYAIVRIMTYEHGIIQGDRWIVKDLSPVAVVQRAGISKAVTERILDRLQAVALMATPATYKDSEHTAIDDLIESRARERVESDERLASHSDTVFAIPNGRTWDEHMTWICEATVDELTAYAAGVEAPG